MKGYVYVLSNPEMPGILKIGCSAHGGARRAKDLFTTGVPAKFILEFELLVDDCYEIETRVHNRLVDKYVESGREFFRVDVKEAIEVITDEAISDLGLSVINADEDDAVLAAKYFAYHLDEHPFIVCKALFLLDQEAVVLALKEYRDWINKKVGAR